jgi:hypothetical protein
VAQVGEELLHLAGQPVDVAALVHARIVAMGTLPKALALVTGFLAYLWVAAVRYAPGVRARKAARRSVQRP